MTPSGPGSPTTQQPSPSIPRVCIVTPVFNGAAYLDQTLHSLCSQAGAFHLRLHVQDGGSRDDTIKKVRQWQTRLNRADFPRVCESITFTWNSEPDAGMYDAINKGFAAIGVRDDDILGWLNSDDLLLPGAAQFACHRMQQFSEVHWIASRPCESDAAGVMRKIHPVQFYNRELLSAGLHDDRHLSFVMQEGSFWRGWLWNRAGGLQANLRLAGDFDLWRRFAAHTPLYSCEQVLAVHRRHPSQLSAQTGAYIAEIDAKVHSTAGRSDRSRLWEAYCQWRNDPNRSSTQFAAPLIVYHPGQDSWFIEHRQPPIVQLPTLFVRPDGAGHRMLACVPSAGFTPAEGPYPELLLSHPIRFAPPGRSSVQVETAARGSYWILIRYRNFTPGLQLEIYSEDRQRHTLPVPVTNHSSDALLAFQLLLQAGQNEFVLAVDSPPGSNGPGLLVIQIEALPAAAVFA